jgi:hypothetical protein
MTQADETTVRALMGDISRAFIDRDVATLDEIFDVDFTLSEPSGMSSTRTAGSGTSRPAIS